MFEPAEQQHQEFTDDDYDPDEGAALINEVMADDDANDPLLDSYQQRPI